MHTLGDEIRIPNTVLFDGDISNVYGDKLPITIEGQTRNVSEYKRKPLTQIVDAVCDADLRRIIQRLDLCAIPDNEQTGHEMFTELCKQLGSRRSEYFWTTAESALILLWMREPNHNRFVVTVLATWKIE